MKRLITLSVLAAGLLTASTAAAAVAVGDDDDDDREWRGRSISRYEAVLIARDMGVVRVHDVDRDDGRWEVQGRDWRGRSIEVEIDGHGRVRDVERSRNRYDRDDDD